VSFSAADGRQAAYNPLKEKEEEHAAIKQPSHK